MNHHSFAVQSYPHPCGPPEDSPQSDGDLEPIFTEVENNISALEAMSKTDSQLFMAELLHSSFNMIQRSKLIKVIQGKTTDVKANGSTSVRPNLGSTY